MQPKIDFIVEIAKEAGQILKDGMGKVHQVEHKGPIDVVTEVDKASEALLVGRIHAAFPEHSIVAEESGITDRQNENCWYIDPVDGTSNYAKGLPIFCVSIAYAKNGQMCLAGVYDPTRDACYTAERGAGAWLGNQRLHVSDTSELIDSMLVTGFPYDLTQKDNNFDHFVRFSQLVQTTRRLGSAVLDQAYVAAGLMDGYWEMGAGPWDIAAGTLLIEEAGGLVTTVKGDAHFFKPPYDLVAANPVLHAKMLEILNEQR